MFIDYILSSQYEFNIAVMYEEKSHIDRLFPLQGQNQRTEDALKREQYAW